MTNPTPRKTPVGTKGYSGNLQGRPVSKLTGLTPSQLKECVDKIKKITPEAVDAIIAYMQSVAGIEKAKAAKELMQLYISLDTHAIRRAGDMHRLLAQVNDGKPTPTADGSEITEDSPRAGVFSLFTNPQNVAQ